MRDLKSWGAEVEARAGTRGVRMTFQPGCQQCISASEVLWKGEYPTVGMNAEPDVLLRIGDSNMVPRKEIVQRLPLADVPNAIAQHKRRGPVTENRDTNAQFLVCDKRVELRARHQARQLARHHEYPCGPIEERGSQRNVGRSAQSSESARAPDAVQKRTVDGTSEPERAREVVVVAWVCRVRASDGDDMGDGGDVAPPFCDGLARCSGSEMYTFCKEKFGELVDSGRGGLINEGDVDGNCGAGVNSGVLVDHEDFLQPT